MEIVGNAQRNVFIFRWKIENFVRFEKILSPIFFAHSIDSGFALELFCHNHQIEESISLYLLLVNAGDEFIEFDIELSCLAFDGSVLISREIPRTQIKERERRGFWDFMPLHDVVTTRRDEFLPQEALTLQCKIWKSNGDMSESVLCFARSRVDVEKSSFVWPIEGFSSMQPGFTVSFLARNASQEDPVLFMNFHLKCSFIEGELFELQLTPPENVHLINGEKEAKDGDKKVFYDLKLSFINASGEETFNQERKMLEYNKSSSLDVLIRDELMHGENSCIVDDVLSLKFQLTFYDEVVSSKIEYAVHGSGEPSDFNNSPDVVLHHHGMNTPISSLKDIYTFLHDTSMFCDVRLQLGTEFIPAHKSIISAMSPTFKSMFEDSNEDIVQVSDVTAEVLHRMILFIYTDTVNDMQLEDAYQLCVAAEIYKVSALKEKCFLTLLENLSTNNAYEMLSFADKHAYEDLKLAVQDFIHENEKEVTG